MGPCNHYNRCTSFTKEKIISKIDEEDMPGFRMLSFQLNRQKHDGKTSSSSICNSSDGELVIGMFIVLEGKIDMFMFCSIRIKYWIR